MKELTIGKLADNVFVIDNGMVSRYHAKIVMDKGGRFEIVDLKSKNGTYVNGRKVRGSQVVRPGDRIVVATTSLPNDWDRLFDQIPDDELEPTTNSQSASNSIDSELLSSVLYDFGKDINVMFSGQLVHLKSIINDFKENRFPTLRYYNVKDFSEDVLDLLVQRYDFVGKQLSILLKLMERESADFQTKYDADIQKLDVTYQYYLRNSKGESEFAANLNQVDIRKNEMRKKYGELRKTVLPMLNSLIYDYYKNNPPLFPDRLELAPVDSAIWNELPNQDGDIQKTFFIGEDVAHYTVFQESVELKKRVYVRSLYGGNLIFKYSKKDRQSCFDAVNALICRMLAAIPTGKMQVVMVDFGEMEGTSSVFKGLNKGVFKVISHNDEYSQFLDSMASYTENVIQNLLQGDLANIAEYNQTKTEKVPYTLIVLKDIPIEYGKVDKLVKILHNGSRAGVSALVLWNEEFATQSEESLDGFFQLREVLGSASFESCIFTHSSLEQEKSKSSLITLPESFPKNLISSIVRKVNQGLEVKTETILKFSEYMLPKKKWWTGRSANHIDLPFGLSEEMKTISLQITQESGQNCAMVIGIPGSGKSVFLHAIIASAITHYSPKELQLYLLDFSGVEFNVYARHNLPHARVIAPEAEREFGLSILREVYEEGNRRAVLCRENNVTNIVELKQKNPDLVVPRLLVIIDEFHKLFEIENDNISKEAESEILTIIKEYRKFGVNLILATQTLSSVMLQLPYDLIANRVVFKSDPRDFDKLITWRASVPQPRLLTGTCIYNNESGAEVANCITRSYFINASKELENLLDEVGDFANDYPEMTDNHQLRTFRSDDLPEFTKRIVAKRHLGSHDFPSEVGIYVGENIAISPCHVYVPLTKDSNNNVLIIGGDPNIAKGIAYYAMISAVAAHTESVHVLMNFMREDDPMQDIFKSELFASASEYSEFHQIYSTEEVDDYLQDIIDNVIDARKKEPSLPMKHFFIHIFEFQRGRMFDLMGYDPSECANKLKYILENGPLVGVFTMLQVDNLDNLDKIECYGRAINMFCHRIALQMSELDSEKIVHEPTASKLLIFNRPATQCRGLYYNNVNNTITKFKPYHTHYTQKLLSKNNQ